METKKKCMSLTGMAHEISKTVVDESLVEKHTNSLEEVSTVTSNLDTLIGRVSIDHPHEFVVMVQSLSILGLADVLHVERRPNSAVLLVLGDGDIIGDDVSDGANLVVDLLLGFGELALHLFQFLLGDVDLLCEVIRGLLGLLALAKLLGELVEDGLDLILLESH